MDKKIIEDAWEIPKKSGKKTQSSKNVKGYKVNNRHKLLSDDDTEEEEEEEQSMAVYHETQELIQKMCELEGSIHYLEEKNTELENMIINRDEEVKKLKNIKPRNLTIKDFFFWILHMRWILNWF